MVHDITALFFTLVEAPSFPDSLPLYLISKENLNLGGLCAKKCTISLQVAVFLTTIPKW